MVPERLGECAALKTLNLEGCSSLIALPERLGECAALLTLFLMGGSDCQLESCTSNFQ